MVPTRFPKISRKTHAVARFHFRYLLGHCDSIGRFRLKYSNEVTGAVLSLHEYKWTFSRFQTYENKLLYILYLGIG